MLLHFFRDCILSENVQIGSGSSVGCNTKIQYDVLQYDVLYYIVLCYIVLYCIVTPCFRDCILSENVQIGKGSSVGCNTKITNSIIGKNCSIGKE